MKRIEHINERDELHNPNGPAVLENGGNRKEWWLNGKLHRIDGPAIVDGSYEEWWLDGKLHRIDGPAINSQDYAAWYKNGKPHREDGPAVVCDSLQKWYINGMRHREDGPAIITYDNGKRFFNFNKNSEIWYINDIERSEEWVKKYVQNKILFEK